MNHPRAHLSRGLIFEQSRSRGVREQQTRDNTFREAGHPPGRASGMQERASLLLGSHVHRVGTLGVRTPACAFMPVAERFTP